MYCLAPLGRPTLLVHRCCRAFFSPCKLQSPTTSNLSKHLMWVARSRQTPRPASFASEGCGPGGAARPTPPGAAPSPAGGVWLNSENAQGRALHSPAGVGWTQASSQAGWCACGVAPTQPALTRATAPSSAPPRDTARQGCRLQGRRPLPLVVALKLKQAVPRRRSSWCVHYRMDKQLREEVPESACFAFFRVKFARCVQGITRAPTS